jgi:hypothetical protein
VIGAGGAAGPAVDAGPSGIAVGDLLGPVGTVDGRGTLRLDGATWRAEWAVGTEDRWHVAADEVAVRQHLLDDTPVVVTAMRVPGGDVIHRAAGISDGTGRAVSIEVENQTATPVSVAFAVRPEGPGSIRALAIEGDRIVVDDRVAMIMGRAAGGTAAVDGNAIWSAVTAEPGPGDVSLASPDGMAGGAVVVALPHRQTVRVVVPISGPDPAPVASSAVAAGWRALADSGARIDVADPELMTRWRAAVPALILSAGTTELDRAAAVAPVLDLLGFVDEADRARATLVAALEERRLDGRAAAMAATALASRRLRSGRDSGLAVLVAVLVDRAGPELGVADVDLIADALEVEDTRAASDVRRLRSSRDDHPIIPPGDDIGRLVGDLVRDPADGLDLLPRPLPDRLAGHVDVRGLVTRHGVVSYSVRWHDHRPALLWEVEASTQPVSITCSGLDPTWSTTATRGEVLLAARL